MQKQKDDIRRKIVKAARKEFISNGFKDASMRVIAKKAEVSLSNIYNYFKNKDDIYKEVLGPVMRAIEETLKEHHSEENITIDFFNSEEFQYQNLCLFVDLVEKYTEDLEMLLFKSDGSSFENFRDNFTNQNTETGVEYLKTMKEKYPYLNIDISEFFIHTISSWMLSIIGEIVTHNLSHEEITRFMSDYINFSTAGWAKLMKV
jgi:AcrR family transcriptional regulator